MDTRPKHLPYPETLDLDKATRDAEIRIMRVYMERYLESAMKALRDIQRKRGEADRSASANSLQSASS